MAKKTRKSNGLKKNLASLTPQAKLKLIDKNSKLPLIKQAELLTLSRSSLYYKPKVDEQEIQIMNWIDEIYTRCPFYGSRRIKVELRKKYSIRINRKKIQRLLRVMGLEAIYPKKKPNTSLGDKNHQKFPYLLKALQILYPNQVWGTDITYIRLAKGFIYLVAIIDWHSRYVVAWCLSENMESGFCIENLQKAFLVNVPEIHNSDQGVQFTSKDYLKVLQEKDIQISMDGRGRCMDNIFTERLWRTVKYENVFIKSYGNIQEAQVGLTEYFDFYNHDRPHQSLDYRTPAEIYFQKT